MWVSTAGGIYPDQGRDIVFGKDGFLYLSGYFALSASFGSQTLTSLGGDAFVSKIDAQTGEYIWLSQVKSSYEIFANSLAVGNNGVVYVAGQSRGTCQFSPQLEVNSRGRDVFLAAYNTENGNALWVETGSGPGSENTYGVGVAGTSLYYTGSFGGYGTFPTFFGDVSLTSPGIFLAKYNLTCDEGYFGINCEITTCFGTNSTDNQTCSSNGECSAFDHCNCDPDWKGDNCDTPTCYGLNHTDFNVCSQHGSCVSANVCLCSSYYFGDRCEMTSCFGAQSNLTQVCSGNGECISHDNCECDSGWFGDNCTISSCFGIMGNLSEVCSGHGVCSSLDFCSCLNYTGNWCQIAWCFGLNNSDQNVCHGRGVCSGYNQCNCTSGSSGSDCSIPLCNSIEATNSSVCSGNGNCVDVNTCNCSSDYGGLFCDKSPQSERGMKSKSRTGLIVGVTVGSIGGVILLLFLVLASVISIVIITKLKGAQLNKSVLPSQQLEMMDMGI